MGRDIKPANVFVDRHHNFKLGDFGLARVLGAEMQFAQTNVGTPYYMAPEQVKRLSTPHPPPPPPRSHARVDA